MEIVTPVNSLVEEFNNLKIYKNSLVLLKYFGNGRAIFKGYCTISKFASIAGLRKKLGIPEEALLYREKLNT